MAEPVHCDCAVMYSAEPVPASIVTLTVRNPYVGSAGVPLFSESPVPRPQRGSDEQKVPLRMLVLTGSQPQAEAASDRDVFQAITLLEGLAPAPALLLCRTGKDEHDARQVRAVLNRSALGVLPLDESETRFRVLAYCLCLLGPQALGQAPVVADALRPALRTRVVLTSVSRLTSPAPSLGQHLQSMLPGSRFELDLNRGRVVRLGSSTWTAPEKGRLAVWAADDESGRVTANLAQLGLHRESLLPMSRRWPTKAWAEMTVLDADPSPLANEALARVARTICSRCGLLATPTGCLMCGTWPYAGTFHPVPAPPPAAIAPDSVPSMTSMSSMASVPSRSSTSSGSSASSGSPVSPAPPAASASPAPPAPPATSALSAPPMPPAFAPNPSKETR